MFQKCNTEKSKSYSHKISKSFFFRLTFVRPRIYILLIVRHVKGKPCHMKTNVNGRCADYKTASAD